MSDKLCKTYLTLSNRAKLRAVPLFGQLELMATKSICTHTRLCNTGHYMSIFLLKVLVHRFTYYLRF